MYHRLGPARLPEEGDYALPIDLFSAHLAVLARSARPVVSLDRLRDRDFPEGALWITFDDGRESDAAEAGPRLKERGFVAAFFVNPALVGQAGNATWTQLRTLAGEGHAVGSHGLDHTLLDGLTDAEAHRQVFEAKRLLEDGLGRPVYAMSLPGGSGGDRVRGLAEEAGFSVVLGSRPGRVEGVARGRVVPRFALRSHHSAEHLASLLKAGGFRWLGYAARFGAAQQGRRLLGETAYGRLRLRWLAWRERGGRG